MKIIFEQVMSLKNVKTEDSGCAKIWTCNTEVDGPDGVEDEDSKVFVRFQSWDEEDWEHHAGLTEHAVFKSFIGKKVRITIESLDVLDQLSEIE